MILERLADTPSIMVTQFEFRRDEAKDEVKNKRRYLTSLVIFASVAYFLKKAGFFISSFREYFFRVFSSIFPSYRSTSFAIIRISLFPRSAILHPPASTLFRHG